MAKYPTITAGTEITADLLNSMLPDYVVKTANTDRTTSTTPTIDPDLQFTLEANATYKIDFVLFYAATDAVGFKTDWTLPSGASGNRSAEGAAWQTTPTSGVATTSAADSGVARSGVHGSGTDVEYGTRNSGSNLCVARESAIITTTTAGTCGINWSQRVSSATASRLGAGSHMVVTRLS